MIGVIQDWIAEPNETFLYEFQDLHDLATFKLLQYCQTWRKTFRKLCDWLYYLCDVDSQIELGRDWYCMILSLNIFGDFIQALAHFGTSFLMWLAFVRLPYYKGPLNDTPRGRLDYTG